MKNKQKTVAASSCNYLRDHGGATRLFVRIDLFSRLFLIEAFFFNFFFCGAIFGICTRNKTIYESGGVDASFFEGDSIPLFCPGKFGIFLQSFASIYMP